MTSTPSEDWYEANQRALAEALAEVREALERFTTGAHGNQPENAEARTSRAKAKRRKQEHAARPVSRETAAGLDHPSRLDQLCATFGLTKFERDVLVLCAGMELDARFAALCVAAHGDSHRAYPTFELALAALPDVHWSAIAPMAALRRWRLIEVSAGERLTASPLRLDERVLHYLVGINYLDERLRGLIEPLPVPEALPPSQLNVAGRVAELWTTTEDGSALPIIQLCGNDPAGKRAVAAAACAVLGIQLQSLSAADVPPTAAERELLARLWEREALLSGSALLVDGENLDAGDAGRALIAFLEMVQGILILSGPQPLRTRQCQIVHLDVNKPSSSEQKQLWHQALGPAANLLNGQLELVATQFNLGHQAITAASDEVLREFRADGEKDPGRLLWDACRAQARPRMEDLAQRIEPAATWDDLVLPPAQLQVLRTIAAHVRQRDRVYERWGFAEKSTRGLGISALFSGATGTGKTMASEVLANELRLDLYRIDLSAMVSKYVGETEKNLRRVFDAAEEGGAILLFDEADALFGRRSEVRDSHDRYANIEVSYLLQRVEAYRGLAVLTSNLKNVLDPAFLRRLRFIVHFPFPDVVQRMEIWRRIFPAHTPTDGLDVEQLARLNLSGGNIRNLALNAAFLAADAGEPVSMKHLLLAAQTEYAKLEKPLSEAEIGGWE